MNQYQKKVLFIVFGILILIAVVAVVWSLFASNGNDIDEPTQPNDPGTEEPTETLSDEFVRLDDESLFFGVQQVINDYYDKIFKEDTNALFTMLDPLYISDNLINSNNIYSFLGDNYGITSYVAKSIYYNPNSSVTYYFVSGYLTSNSIMGDEYEYDDNASFLVIVDESSRYYVLRPISTSNLVDYIENYDVVERNFDQGNIFQTVNVTIENKLSTYLNEFINFLIYNPREAYNLLDDDTLNQYQGYDDFASQALDIYESLSARIFSYSSTEENDLTIYDIIDNNQNSITIYEYGIMDFQISY